jgi:phage tail-like protein
MKTARISTLLPSVYQTAATGGTPLLALLNVMETLHAPVEVVLDQLDTFFDPYRAPDPFVPYLASWVDLQGILDRPQGTQQATLSSGVGRLRELTAGAVNLSRWRGTRKGLLLFLETATGISGFEIDEEALDGDGKVIPFHIRISAPASSLEHKVLLQRIIELEKPAYVTYDLTFTPSVPSEASTR